MHYTVYKNSNSTKMLLYGRNLVTGILEDVIFENWWIKYKVGKFFRPKGPLKRQPQWSQSQPILFYAYARKKLTAQRN